MKKPALPSDHRFGHYIIRVDGNHVVIQREDNQPAQPTFYEMLHMKCLAFGAQAVAIEVYPACRELIDSENQRHLWLVDEGQVPNLFNGKGVRHTRGQR